jgi:hypothetical protein
MPMTIHAMFYQNPDEGPASKTAQLPAVYPGIIELCHYLNQFTDGIKQQWEVTLKGKQLHIALTYRYHLMNTRPDDHIVRFSFSLRTNQLWDAYCTLPDKELNYDFTQDTVYIHEILKVSGIEMLEHIGSFTGVTDDYSALASLCNFTGVKSKLRLTRYGLL